MEGNKYKVNKGLIRYNETVFEKVKKFLNKFFKKNESKEILNKNKDKNNFIENIVISKNKSTVGQTKKLKACTLYSKSNLSGYKYQYKANTTVTILQHVNSYIDKVKVKANGRVAYIKVNSYK